MPGTTTELLIQCILRILNVQNNALFHVAKDDLHKHRLPHHSFLLSVVMERSSNIVKIIHRDLQMNEGLWRIREIILLGEIYISTRRQVFSPINPTWTGPGFSLALRGFTIHGAHKTAEGRPGLSYSMI
jgi:hypothetical protein